MTLSARVTAGRNEQGFSLVELLMAMALTIIVASSILGLLYAGQSSFRRDPERMEAEQNVRAAMEAVMADVGTAGIGMTYYTQTFTPGLDGGAGSDKLE